MRPISLVAHVNADGDIIRAWLAHYRTLGVSDFKLVVHGPPEENAVLLGCRDEFPIQIVDAYEGVFDLREKRIRLERVLDMVADQWVLLVDSDEFVELPLDSLEDTITALERARAGALSAPMVQRIRRDGSLDTPAVVDDPFAEFPLCAPSLYRDMGVRAALDKFPLIRRGRGQRVHGGSHVPPAGVVAGPPSLRGVTHHFKWRAPVWERLRRRASSAHPFRHESVGYLDYLAGHEARVPVDGAFEYSRDELFRRRLLRRPGALERLVAPLRRAPALAPARRLLAKALRRR